MESNGNNPTQNHNRQPDNHENKTKSTSRIKKLQQRTTSIALSVLVAISFGVIGFEVLSANSKNAKTTTSTSGTKALSILAREKENEQAGLTTNLPDTWNTKRSNAETVKEINRLQTKKIKELKRELSEANHKLHDLKAHLFTKGDPADRARLAEVCQELCEKDRHNEDFQKKITELETERELRSQKITRMEQTIDALASMTDTQRETKEKAIFNLQSQIERLEEDAKRERDELKKTLAQLEESNIDLEQSIDLKISAINTLEEEISWQYDLLQEKDQDLQEQSQLFTRSKNHLEDELKNISDAFELEMLKNQNLSSDIQIAQAREKAQEQYTKSLENQLSRDQALTQKDKELWNQTMVELANEYMELQGILDVYAHSHDHFTNKQQKLSALVREEKFQVNMLKDELDAALATADAEQQRGFCIEEELHATAHKVLQMEDELNAKQAIVDSKQQELDMLTYSNASLRDQLHARIEQLTALLDDSQKDVRRKEASVRELAVNLELERSRVQELDHNLKDALTRNIEESDIIRELQEQVHEKSERLAAMDERLINRKDEIQELQEEVLNLTNEYEQEKRRSNELHLALTNSLNENTSVYDSYTKLQGTVEDNTDMVTHLQESIESKKNTIDKLRSKLDEVTIRLNSEQMKSREMEIALEDSNSLKQEEIIRGNAFQNESQEATQELNILRQELAQKESRIDELRYQIEAQEGQVETLLAQLEIERNQSNILEDHAYQSQINESGVEEIRATASKQDKQIKKMQETIANLNQKVELERHRAMAYEKANSNETSHARKLETELEKFAARIVELQNIVRDQESQITEMRKGKEKENDVAFNSESTQPSVREAPPAVQIANTSIKHTVEEGESLGIISTYYYGTPNRWIDLYNANRKVILDKNRLDPGVTIIIPQ